jgi:putative endonuclease
VFYLYILKLSDGSLYTGFTSDLKRRYPEHVNGGVKSTKHKRPLSLIYYEAYLSEVDARKRERYLKSGGNAKKVLRDQIQDTLTIK